MPIAAGSPASIVEYYLWILEPPTGIVQDECILRSWVQVIAPRHTAAHAADGRLFIVVITSCSRALLHLAEWLHTPACCKPKWPQGHCTAAAGPWCGCEHCKQGKCLIPFNGGASLLLSNPIGMKYMGPRVMISSDAYCCWQPCFHSRVLFLNS
jgi:hypothetical protein